jgi:hypothetical protein
MDKREPDDPSPYLLAIWTPGENKTAMFHSCVYSIKESTARAKKHLK